MDFLKDKGMNLKKIFYILLFVMVVLLITILAVLISMGYEKTLSFLIDLFKFERYTNQIQFLISKNKFITIQIVVLFQIVFFSIIIKYYEFISHKFIIYLNDLNNSLSIYKNLFKGVNLYIVILPIISIVYFAFSLPISYDEAWTYLNFTERGIISSLAYYPAPNNHILHSLLTNLIYYILPFAPLLCLRLPTIIISLLLIGVSIAFLTKHYNQKVGILVSGLFPILYMSLYFSYMSRGYALVLLFFVLSLNFILNIIKNNNQERDWFWFTIFSVLGFFTMPSYLYVFIIMNTILLIFYKKSILYKQIKSLFFIITAVCILYLPVIIVSGLNSLINNKFVAPISRDIVISKLPVFFTNALENLFGFNIYISGLIFLISILLIGKNKDWFHLKLLLIFLTLPPILLVAHSVIPFSRTFNYYTFILIYLFIISIRFYIEKVNIKILLIIILFIQALLILNFNHHIYNSEVYAIKSKEINSEILEDDKLYVVNSNLFDAYLFYELKVNDINNYKVKYYPHISMSADTIYNSDYTIIDIDVDETKVKKPIYTTDFYNIY